MLIAQCIVHKQLTSSSIKSDINFCGDLLLLILMRFENELNVKTKTILFIFICI